MNKAVAPVAGGLRLAHGVVVIVVALCHVVALHRLVNIVAPLLVTDRSPTPAFLAVYVAVTAVWYYVFKTTSRCLDRRGLVRG